MLTIEQIAYRHAQKYNAIPRSARTHEDDCIKDAARSFGPLPLYVTDEILMNSVDQSIEFQIESNRQFSLAYLKFISK